MKYQNWELTQLKNADEILVSFSIPQNYANREKVEVKKAHVTPSMATYGQKGSTISFISNVKKGGT